MNMSKMKKLMKTRARGDFEYNRNDDEYYKYIHGYEDSGEEEEKEDRIRENEKLINMSKIKKLTTTIARGDFEYNTYNNRNGDEY